MDIKDHEFNIGDIVITTSGEMGKIIDFCDCEWCLERGFCEPMWVEDDDDSYVDYITITEAQAGFKKFYSIGKYRFNDFDKDTVLRSIAYCEEELKRLRRQLKVIEDTESEAENESI